MLSRLRRKSSPAVEPVTPPFAYCETVMATPTSPVHIRRIGSEGLKVGGGAPNTVLCGRDLMHGWDLAGPPVDPDTVARGAALKVGTPGRVCAECAGMWSAENT